MAVIVFTNPATALVFEATTETDHTVHVGCDCNGGRGYSGKLSGLPPGAALVMVQQGSNLVKAKPAPESNQQPAKVNRKSRPSEN